jgi:hypothetical protein
MRFLHRNPPKMVDYVLKIMRIHPAIVMFEFRASDYLGRLLSFN